MRIIGAANDWQTEVECLLLKHHIFPRPFSAAAMGCLPIVRGGSSGGGGGGGDDSSNGSGSSSSSGGGDSASGGSDAGAGHGTWVDSHWSIPLGTPLTDPSTVLDFKTIINNNHTKATAASVTTTIATMTTAAKTPYDHTPDSINIHASAIDTAWTGPCVNSSQVITRTDLRQARRVFSVDPPGCQVS